MTNLVSNAFKDTLIQVKGFVLSKVALWSGRTVAYLKNAMSYLKDPRYGSGAIFMLNFVILEVAFRISKIVEILLPNATKTQDNIQFICRLILTTSLVMAVNVGFIKAVEITLPPLVVTAIVIASFIVKTELERFVLKK